MKINHLILIIVFSQLLGCQTNNTYVPDLSENISYNYRETKYSVSPNNDSNIISIKYFNNEDQLIEEIGHEYRVKYTYDETGKLTEEFNCRIYNCKIGWRSILIYDSSENHIGTYLTRDSLVNIDTVEFEQIKFYNKNDNLVKELVRRHSDIDGNKYEYWKFYEYADNRISIEIEKRNDNIVWKGHYYYDKKGNLISIKRKNKDKYENEFFEYDQKNRLIKWIIESNEWPLKENVSYSVNNNSTIYEYNDKGMLIKEVTYNHKGEKYRTFNYQYDTKK